MALDYIIQRAFEAQWLQGQEVSQKLLKATGIEFGKAYFPVHGDPLLRQLDDDDLLCYFIYSLSSWWEIPVIDRINANREGNNFAIIMDINPAPETMYRLGHSNPETPEIRYKTGLKEMFPSLKDDVANAMYNLLRNGFGHNLFGREPGKIQFDNSVEFPPTLDSDNVLVVPPVKLALSMINAFLPRIGRLWLSFPKRDIEVFRLYMTNAA